MVQEKTADELIHLTKMIPDLILNIGELKMSLKPNVEKWSKKEILGHLTDSAFNNIQRLIRARYEKLPEIIYNADEWVRLQGYQALPLQELVNLWTALNRQLAFIIGRLNSKELQEKCRADQEAPASLEFISTDYLKHLKHHLSQIVSLQ